MNVSNNESTMKTRFLTVKHRVWGEIGLESEGERVHFFCNWPFDLNTNEWIQLRNTFPLKDYLSKVRRLPKQKKVTIRGSRSGHLSFIVRSRGRIEFDLAVKTNEVSQESFSYVMTASPKDLLPTQHGGGKTLLEQPNDQECGLQATRAREGARQRKSS